MSKLRGSLYKAARILGDIESVSRGRVGKRIARRAAGKMTGRALGKTCFIATVVYDDINAPEVQVLRNYRGNVLMENNLGRKLVDFYYSGIGEKVATCIRQRPFLIPLIKKGLDYIVNTELEK